MASMALASTMRARSDWRRSAAWRRRQSLVCDQTAHACNGEERLVPPQPQPPSGNKAAAEAGIRLPRFSRIPRCAGNPTVSQPTGRCFPAFDEVWVELLHEGDGATVPKAGDVALVHYTTLLAASGSCVGTSRCDTSGGCRPMRVVIGAKAVVDGMDAGLRTLSLGAVARIYCPARFGYGTDGGGRAVPPNADLVFEVELVEVNSKRPPSKGHPTSRKLRALFAVPPPERLLSREQSLARGAAACAGCREAAAADARRADAKRRERAARRAALGDAPREVARDTGSDDDAAAAEEYAEEAANATWVRRLRPQARMPIDETRSFFELVDRLGPAAFEDALRGDGPDGTPLLPGTQPIRRILHGARWD